MEEKFIQTQVLYSLLDFEPYILVLSLIALIWIFYKLFLQEVSQERHKIIQNHMGKLIRHFLGLSFIFFTYIVLNEYQSVWSGFIRIKPYVAIVCFYLGLFVFVKACRLLVLLYMFMSSMHAGVPLLIMNIFSLLLSTILLFWSGSLIFGIQLGPLLATSAVFSIVLGLALQDTLGNLFAGVSLQIDRSFEIGDWLEITQGSQKTIGQVKEISWRSVTLVGISDEIITMPNRTVATAQISNFSPANQPIIRIQVFKIKHEASIAKAKEVLERLTSSIGEIRVIPAPIAHVYEVTENWIGIKLIYFIDSYESQNNIADKVLRKGVEELQKNAIPLARQHIEYSGINKV